MSLSSRPSSQATSSSTFPAVAACSSLQSSGMMLSGSRSSRSTPGRESPTKLARSKTDIRPPGAPASAWAAINRLSDTFDLYSLPGAGTVIVSRIWRGAAPGAPKVDAAGVCAMMEGESVSGDDFAIRDVEGRTRIVVADGLGHGPGAAEASAEAVRIFSAGDADSLAELLDSMHRSLRATRGQPSLSRRSTRTVALSPTRAWATSPGW